MEKQNTPEAREEGYRFVASVFPNYILDIMRMREAEREHELRMSNPLGKLIIEENYFKHLNQPEVSRQ